MGRSLVLSFLVIAGPAIATPAHAECSPAQRRAIDLSNDADRLRAIDLDSAIAKYEEALAADPTNHRIFHKLALAQTKKENWDAAGVAYASIVPPQKSQAMVNLQTFHKMICKGAAAARYADQCQEAQALAYKIGATLQ